MSESMYKVYRPAAPNERRVIVRQSLGFYGSLVIGGVYTMNRSRLQSQSPSPSQSSQLPNKPTHQTWHHLLLHALRHCIQTHPILGACIWAESSEHPTFAAGPSILLDQQISHINVDVDWSGAKSGSVLAAARDDPENWLETLGSQILHTQLPLRLGMEGKRFRPAWRVGVQELPPIGGVGGGKTGGGSGSGEDVLDRFLITLTFSHGLGDGMSGLAFHRTLLEGLNVAIVDQPNLESSSSSSSATEHPDPTAALSVMHHSELADHLPPPIEEAANLTVSLRYLLAPVLGEKLPRFLARWLGLRATVIPEAENAWIGRELYFVDPEMAPASQDPTTITTPGLAAGTSTDPPTTIKKKPQGLIWLRIPSPTIRAVLAQCRSRSRQTRMTGLLHQLLVRALSETLPAQNQQGKPIESIITQTAVNLRRAVEGLGDDDMALCVTGYYEVFGRDASISPACDPAGAAAAVGATAAASATDAIATTTTTTTTMTSSNEWTTAPPEHPLWKATRTTTAALERQATTTHNQPIGLLRFLTDMRRWTGEQVGKRREASYEVSNLGVFDPWARAKHGTVQGQKLGQQGQRGQQMEETDTGTGTERAEVSIKETAIFDIESMIFSQPANMVGGVFDANVVSVKGGEMVICFCWQVGALGLASDAGREGAGGAGVGGVGVGGDGGVNGKDEAITELELEERFMKRVAGSLKRSLDELAAAELE